MYPGTTCIFYQVCNSGIIIAVCLGVSIYNHFVFLSLLYNKSPTYNRCL